jgi:hypothetical protein
MIVSKQVFGPDLYIALAEGFLFFMKVQDDILMYMNDDQFTKLVNYIKDFRSEVNTKLDQKASQDNLERFTQTSPK